MTTPAERDRNYNKRAFLHTIIPLGIGFLFVASLGTGIYLYIRNHFLINPLASQATPIATEMSTVTSNPSPTFEFIPTLTPTIPPECMSIEDLWKRPGQTRNNGYTVNGQGVSPSTEVCVY